MIANCRGLSVLAVCSPFATVLAYTLSKNLGGVVYASGRLSNATAAFTTAWEWSITDQGSGQQVAGAYSFHAVTARSDAE
ncbi:hypothetical protein MRX96_037699 [Rhipicephalus microplus]